MNDAADCLITLAQYSSRPANLIEASGPVAALKVGYMAAADHRCLYVQ
jgi:hypothetical protein